MRFLTILAFLYANDFHCRNDKDSHMATQDPSSMRAWQFAHATGGLEKQLRLEKFAPLPSKAKSLGANQVLVKVLSASLNPVDYKIPEVPFIGRLVVGNNATPGMDFAGTVAATGADVKDLRVGQPIFGRLDGPTKYGTLAEYTVAPRYGCVALPPSVSPDDGACIASAGITAYQSIAPYVKPGDRVFINGGSGGTGVFAIQIAKILGCYVVTCCSAANVALCRSLSADEVIDYKKYDVIEELKRIQKFDLVVDNVGTSSALYWQAHEFTNLDARFVLVGTTLSLASTYDLVCRLLWPGFLGGGKRKISVLMAASKPDDFKQLADWVSQGKLKMIVDEIFDMEDKGPVKAFEKLKTGRAKGKIVIKIAAS